MNHQTVKLAAPARPGRAAQHRQDDLPSFLRRIVADAVSRMALKDADRRVPQSHRAKTWRASRA